jgi:hypothetical protein
MNRKSKLGYANQEEEGGGGEERGCIVGWHV